MTPYFCTLKNEKVESKHVILVCLSYAQKPPLNAHADISSGPRGLHDGFIYCFVLSRW